MPIVQNYNFAITDSVRAAFKNGRYLKGIHMHQFAEIVYVMEGELTVRLSEGEEIAQAGDLVVISPYQYHGLYTKIGNTVKLWLFLFTDTLIMDLIRTEADYDEYDSTVFTPSPALRAFLEAKMIDTDEKLREIDTKERRYIKALLYPIFDEYLSSTSVSKKQTKKNPDIINAIVKYTKINFFNDITVDDCSKSIGYSKSHISHCLSQNLNVTFSELRNQFRINYAKNLLRFGNMSVFNIGIECGFNCKRSFEKAFKQITGKTPTQYRLNL